MSRRTQALVLKAARYVPRQRDFGREQMLCPCHRARNANGAPFLSRHACALSFVESYYVHVLDVKHGLSSLWRGPIGPQEMDSLLWCPRT